MSCPACDRLGAACAEHFQAIDAKVVSVGGASDLVSLAEEINAEHEAIEALMRTGLERFRRAGELLIEAKGRCKHGDWMPWLAENCPRVADRTARLYMQVASRWPELANRQDIAGLGIAEAQKLLAQVREPLSDDEPQEITDYKDALKKFTRESKRSLESLKPGDASPEAVQFVKHRHAEIQALMDEIGGLAVGDPERDVAPRVVHNSGEVEWYTPPLYIAKAREVMEEIDLDPASCEAAQKVVQAKRYYTAEEDGLAQEWSGRVWLNPPYARGVIERFAEKLVQEVKAGNVEQAIVLTNDSTDAAWFHTLAEEADVICFPRKRVKFLTPTGGSGAPLQGQTFFFFGADDTDFLRAFLSIGLVFCEHHMTAHIAAEDAA